MKTGKARGNWSNQMQTWGLSINHSTVIDWTNIDDSNHTNMHA